MSYLASGIIILWSLYLLLVWNPVSDTRKKSTNYLMAVFYQIALIFVSLTFWPTTWFNVLGSYVGMVLIIVFLGLWIAALHDERDARP